MRHTMQVGYFKFTSLGIKSMSRKIATLRVGAHHFVQHGVSYYTLSITPTLINFLDNEPQIKRYQVGKDGQVGEHYQREQSSTKVDQIAKYIEDPNNALIDPVNINMPMEHGKLEFKPIGSDPSIGYVIIPKNAILNFYDGGHRVLGAKKAWELSDSINFDLPATLSNLPIEQEMLMFCVKNITVDRIASDLLIDMKVKLNGSLQEVNGEKRYLPPKMTKDTSWLAEAREISRLMVTEDSGRFSRNPWANRMTMPNQTREGYHWFKFGKFTEYLRPVANNSFDLLPETIEDRAVLICNMWKAIQKLVPAAFTEYAFEYRLTTGHVSIEPISRLVNSFMLYHLHNGKMGKYRFFHEAAEAVCGQNVIPTVDDFVKILNKCSLSSIGTAGKPNKLFTESHWHVNGQSRHYHGKGNVSILINEVNDSLGIPHMKRNIRAEKAV